MEDILFYGSFNEFSVASFIQRLNAAKKAGVAIRVLANSSGGDPDAGYGFIQQLREFPNNKSMLVHGAAYSMMAYAALYTEEVDAIEQSQFLFHRAASFFEDINSVEFNGLRELLANRNQNLRTGIEQKLDVDAFERIGGVTLDEMFSMESRKDVIFTAAQAKEIGLVKNVLPLSSNKAEEINSALMAASSGSGVKLFKVEKKDPPKPDPSPEDEDKKTKNSKMNTLEELKAKHPELYAQAIQAGAKIGADQERERVGQWAAYLGVNAKKVAEGIKGDKPLDSATREEFILASAKKGFVNSMEAEEKGKGVDTDDPDGADEKTKEVNAFEAKVRKAAGLES